MTEFRHFAKLHDPVQGREAIARLWNKVRPWLTDGHVLEVRVGPETRTSSENALLHAMLTYISRHHEWAGKKRDVETWKRLMVAAWSRATGEPIEFLPALDGHGVDIVFRRTSQLSKRECADLIEFVYAWGAQNDLDFPANPALE